MLTPDTVANAEGRRASWSASAELIRADDAVSGRRWGGERLADLINTVRDPRTRAEIHRQAVKRLSALEHQLAELQSRGETELATEAAEELAAQRAYVKNLESPEDEGDRAGEADEASRPLIAHLQPA